MSGQGAGLKVRGWSIGQVRGWVLRSVALFIFAYWYY